MAEALLSYAMEEILKKVQFVVTNAIIGAWGLKDDLQKLSDSMGRLRSLLQKAQNLPTVEDDESINRWLDKLQTVVYAAADVLDEFHYEILRREVEVKNQLKRKLPEYVSCNNPILFRVKMAAKVKEVRASLVDVEKEAPLVMQTITIPTITVAAEFGAVPYIQSNRMTDSLLAASERPIGRTNEVKGIIKILQGEIHGVTSATNDAQQLSVISIVGFGGLGKTTLAKLVFEEAEKNRLFNDMMWVCVSEPFDVKKILGEMLQKQDSTTGGLTNIDVIIRTLRQQLKDKSFLLVLDDVWNKEFAKWEELKRCLEIICSKSGNFVLTTTRSSEVAEIMGTQHIVELQQLSDTECWSIIKEKVFGDKGKSIISHEMETIGKEIASKCGGVPLVAKVVGGLLSSRNDKSEWLSIRRSHVWNEVDKEKRIYGTLKLSFDHLPQPQKPCFAFCSLFPKDFVFDKTQLIQHWMAEDFLNTTIANGGISTKLMEDVGEEYFHSLLVNSFFQDVIVDEFGNVVYCKMHDLLHDLALTISKSQRLQCGSYCIQTSYGRHLQCSCDQDSKVEEILQKSKNKARYLRSLFCRVDISPILSNFKSLRSLDMSDSELKNLPTSIRKLKHLRYLDISKNETMQELPKSITNLYNLQTLRILECKSLKKLPNKIMNLVSLRHIYFDDKRLMPFKVGCLTNLQTLPFFVVGVKNGQRIDELGGLNELRGELVVCGLENVRDKGEAERAKMKEKKLSKLRLQWMALEESEVENFSSLSEGMHEEVIEGVEAPASIQVMTIEWYMGKQFSQWMCELSKLVRLVLNNCRRCVRMPTLGHLPNLKILRVERMDCMKSIGNEFCGKSNNGDTLFPLLEELSVRKMNSLVEWETPKGTGMFPKLRKLYIEDCPDLTNFPLSELTSTATYMLLTTSTLGTTFVDILCFQYFRSIQDLKIEKCRKLTFLHIDLASLVDVKFYVGNVPREQKEWVKNFPQHSNEVGGRWGNLRIEGDVKIIEEFPKSLEALEIEKLDKMLSVEAFHGLSCLKHLVVKDCHRLDSIPALSPLTSLTYLQISGCDILGSVPNLSSLTSLTYLHISGCSNLKSIPALSSLTSLTYLEISGCHILEPVLALSSFTSLKHLEIIHCYRLELIPTLSFPISLEIIRLENFQNLTLNSNSFSTLTSLEKLSILGCDRPWGLSCGIKFSTPFKELIVTYSGTTMSIDDDIIASLTQLKKLEWGGFSEELDQFPLLNAIHLLTSLKELKIIGCDKLESLPHQLQHLTSITHLEIRDFYRMETFPDWLCNFLSLQTLHIEDCMILMNLPTNMQCLSKLKELYIRRCPFMKERCSKVIGPEWSKISHIPYIKINFEVIQDLRYGTDAQRYDLFRDFRHL